MKIPVSNPAVTPAVNLAAALVLALTCYSSPAFSHGTVVDQLEAVSKRTLKDFSEKRPQERDAIVSYLAEKTGEELYMVKIKTSKKEFSYKCGMDVIEKNRWGCKLL